MDKHELVSAEKLAAMFKIDAKGTMVRSVNSKRTRIGDVPGTVGTDGYVRVWVAGHIFYAHRVVWAVANGAWPDMEVDHINGDKQDNRLQNLRLVARQQNMQNRRKAPSQSTTGVLGVRYIPAMKSTPWRAVGWLNGKNVGLGYFADKESAYNCYVQWKRVAHEGCTI